jgi:uncharacterized protein
VAVEQYVIDLKDLGHEKVQLQGKIDPGALDFSGDNVKQTTPMEWAAALERAGAEIRVTGSLKTAVEQACSRCLEPARFEIAKPFDLYFGRRDELVFDADEEIELNERDTQTAFFTGTHLHIGDILREQVLLGLPMKALCRVDCKGLCPQCGTNLNFGSCNCPKESFSPHMETLLQLKKRLEERSS